jgi:TolB-like protein/tetratricopeptide (TPR) repeat protein
MRTDHERVSNGVESMMKTRQSIMKKMLLSAACLMIVSCAQPQSAPVYVKDGQEYGKTEGAIFRHRWWNYYERGLSYAEGKFYQEAVSDLKQALEQRSQDQRMARTYGMHFVDYFPHRELGIVFYRMGELMAAQGELELSISHYPSSKARFYLDRVRKTLIEREGEKDEPPKLVLDLWNGEIWTREDPVTISGVAEDEGFVAGVSIMGVPLFLEQAQTKVPFKKACQLPQGRHEVAVEARNLLGKKTSRNVVIRVDREGPVITVEKIEEDQTAPEGAIVIIGSVYDEAGVLELLLNKEPIRSVGAVEVSFRQRIPKATKELEMAARDRLGNETSATIPLDFSGKVRPPMRLALAGSGESPLVLTASAGKDTRPPEIKLKGWTESQTVFLDKIYIEGQAVDEGTVESLTINQTPVLRRKGQSIFFGHLAELREGDNEILIEAKDQAGNLGEKKLLVKRRIPQALQIQERLSLSVLPFEQNGVVSESSLSFQDRLIDSLVNQNRFRVVERAKLDVILQEQKLSSTELIDKNTALRLGKLVAAQSIVTGSIIETGTGMEIVARVVDTETSEILASEDVYDEVKDPAALRSLAEGMAVKFHRAFPLLDGLVLQQRGNTIFTDLGQDKIKLNRRLLVFKEEPVKHPVTGKIVGADHVIVGRARVSQVMPEMSKADLLDGKPEAVKLQDKVITE